MRRRWLVLALIVVAVAACSAPSSAPAPTEAPTAPVVTAAPVGVSSGDWVSVDAYVLDMVDTSDKVAQILGVFEDAAFDVETGLLSLSAFSDIAWSAVGAIDTHIVYFAGTVPPSGYEESHRLLLDALDAYRLGFELAADGSARGNVALIDQANVAFLRGIDLTDQATAALP